MLHSKRSYLTTQDVNNALRLRNVEVINGGSVFALSCIPWSPLQRVPAQRGCCAKAVPQTTVPQTTPSLCPRPCSYPCPVSCSRYMGLAAPTQSAFCVLLASQMSSLLRTPS
jgi:hypothetical protein